MNVSVRRPSSNRVLPVKTASDGPFATGVGVGGIALDIDMNSFFFALLRQTTDMGDRK
jgi:hypothetical protein